MLVWIVAPSSSQCLRATIIELLISSTLMTHCMFSQLSLAVVSASQVLAHQFIIWKPIIMGTLHSLTMSTLLR